MFHYYSPDELLSLGVMECTNENLKGPNTVNDIKLGTTNKVELCDTCGQDWKYCPGHMGYVVLNTPFIHPFAIKPTIYVLQCICNNCGTLLLNTDDYLITHAHEIMVLSDMVRLKKIAELTVEIMKTKPCGNIYEGKKCNFVNPTYEFPKATSRKEDNRNIYIVVKMGSEKLTVPQPIENIEKIFKYINSRDLSILGFNEKASPSNFIMKVFPILPETNRPTKVIDGKSDPDQLTIAYTEIIKYNKALGEGKTKIKLASTATQKEEWNKKIEEAERDLYRVIMLLLIIMIKNTQLALKMIQLLV